MNRLMRLKINCCYLFHNCLSLSANSFKKNQIMCNTCGCGQGEEITIRKPGEISEQHIHEHTHDGSVHPHIHHGADDHHHHHGHDHSHSHDHGREVMVEQDVLLKNNLLAERNRGYFEAKNLTALNLVSSPVNQLTGENNFRLKRTASFLCN